MTDREKDLELIALRALLKEAVGHGVHNNECQVFQHGMDEDHCNCWMFYAAKVVVEAEQAEQAQQQLPQPLKVFAN